MSIERVTFYALDTNTGELTEKFKLGGQVRFLSTDELALNGFAITDTGIRVSVGKSNTAKQVQAGDVVELGDGGQFNIQSIDDSNRKVRRVLASGP